jgi:hypothetical protein
MVESKDNFEVDKNRLSVIDEIFDKFGILFSKKKYYDIPSDFSEEKRLCIKEINKIFDELKIPEIEYILYSFNFAKDKSVKNLINFLDTMNSILSHFEYYQRKNPKIKYNNAHFDNYLLKRYECADIFTNYIIDRGCRELKIDNKLFFNYIPIKCNMKKHLDAELKAKLDSREVEGCPFCHKNMEATFHPFVYKKFKCFKKKCDDVNCVLYHVDENNNDNPIDMETEVDFDSDEIINLSKVLSTLRMSPEDIKNDEHLGLFLQKKARETGDYIPSEFNPSTYKIFKCPLGPICKLDKKLCLNYHGDGDRRRNPDFYKAILCPNLFQNNKKIKNAKCKLGDDCDCAHNLYEYYYHPNKFRTVPCPQEKKNQLCKERLICPYVHKTDYDCGKDGKRMTLDKELISDYYKSLMVKYEKSIDKEIKKLRKIEEKYYCYVCGGPNTCVLNKPDFLVDPKESKIICEDCAEKKRIKGYTIAW